MTTRESVDPQAIERLRTRLRGMLAMLALVFLLGMGANLIGAPDENNGVGRIVSIVLVALHALLAIGIVATAIRVMPAARDSGIGRREAMIGLVTVIITFLAGIGTVLTGSGWLSFIMAAGFLVAAGAYVIAAIAASRSGAARSSEA